jgi:hypothetical protein
MEISCRACGMKFNLLEQKENVAAYRGICKDCAEIVGDLDAFANRVDMVDDGVRRRVFVEDCVVGMVEYELEKHKIKEGELGSM